MTISFRDKLLLINTIDNICLGQIVGEPDHYYSGVLYQGERKQFRHERTFKNVQLQRLRHIHAYELNSGLCSCFFLIILCSNTPLMPCLQS
jgi:hypothetical protein